jgi:Mg2+ and Co2+ transporter CorA
MTVKQFLLKKFPTNEYMDCPVPKHYWEIMQEYADKFSAPALESAKKRVEELEAELLCERSALELKSKRIAELEAGLQEIKNTAFYKEYLQTGEISSIIYKLLNKQP